VDNLSKKDKNGNILFEDVSFTVNSDDKIGILCDRAVAMTTFFELLAGKDEPDSGP
jgi:ATPase subunit of ABC transporter with duplicated ATPase domains